MSFLGRVEPEQRDHVRGLLEQALHKAEAMRDTLLPLKAHHHALIRGIWFNLEQHVIELKREIEREDTELVQWLHLHYWEQETALEDEARRDA